MIKVYDESLKQLEKLITSDDIDYTPTLDNTTTTVAGWLKRSIEDNFREDHLKDKNILNGTIFRLPIEYRLSNYDHTKMVSSQQTSARENGIYKVRLADVNGFLDEIPKTYDGTPEDIQKIDSYPDFRCFKDLNLRLGDKVRVKLLKTTDYTKGIILGRIPENLQDYVSTPIPSTGDSSQSAFSDQQNISQNTEIKNILLIGDSHTVGPYGIELQRLFEKDKKTVDRVASVGCTAAKFVNNTWKKGTSSPVGDFEQAKKTNYDIIIVSIGTNDASGIKTVDGARKIADDIKTLISMLNGKVKYWVSPPQSNPVAASTYNKNFASFDLNKRIELVWQETNKLFGNNSIDSRVATKEVCKTTGSDIHFKKYGGSVWAEYVYKRITR